MRLLLDTHIWFWSLARPERLARKIRAGLGSGRNELWLSSISAWELVVLAERGRVKIEGDPRKWVANAFTRAPVQEALLNYEVAIRSREVMPEHGDPADRFLVATALVYDLALLTSDAALIDARPCHIVPNR